MKSRGIILLTFFLFAPVVLSAQEGENNPPDKELISKDQSGVLSNGKLDIKHYKPLNFNLYTGSSFFYSGRFGSGNTFYIGSNAAFILSPRFTLEFGTSLNFNRLTGIPSGFYPENDLNHQPFNFSGITLYTRGSYYFSERLRMNATAFKQFSTSKYHVINPFFTSYNSEGMSVELNYKLFRNVNVGAQFNFIRNDNPFFPSQLTYPEMNNILR